MPDLSPALAEFGAWLQDNAFALVVFFGLLLLAFRGARPLIHRILVGVVKAQQVAIGDAPTHELEMERRVATIEDLLNKAVRLGVALAIVALFLGVFDLWSLLAGFGLVVAAIAFAGQAIILDLLMGTLILLEAQYFKGDFVSVGLVEGTVEEVGIRRTVVRDVRGTLHSVSNGLIRQSANFTRTYAQATVDIDGVADGDVEAVIEVMNVVGKSIADDADLGPLLQDVPGYASTLRLSAGGATLRLSGRVRPESRARIEAEMRRRVAAELASHGIELIRPGAYQPRP